LLRKLASRKRVEFIVGANDEQVRELYRRAWVNVLPTRHVDCYGNLEPAPELMGLTLLEAMACGTPVICHRAGAMPEFVQPGETGFVYDDIGELSGRLRYLADHRDEVERMGRRARQVVEEEFDYHVVGRKLLALYERVVAARARQEVAA
jgi:glycosyltransferase involved in cell wall biosynthesis